MDIQIRGRGQPSPPQRPGAAATAVKVGVIALLAVVGGKLLKRATFQKPAPERPAIASAAAPRAVAASPSPLPESAQEPERPDPSSLLLTEEELAPQPRQVSAAAATPSKPNHPYFSASPPQKPAEEEPAAQEYPSYAQMRERRADASSHGTGGAPAAHGGGASSSASFTFRPDNRHMTAAVGEAAGGSTSAKSFVARLGRGASAALDGSPGRLPPSQWPTLQQMRQAFASDARLAGPLPSSIGGGPNGLSLGGNIGAQRPSQPSGQAQSAEAPQDSEGGSGNAGGQSNSGSSSSTPGKLQTTTPSASNSPIPWTAAANATGLQFPDVSMWRPVSDWKALSNASHGIIEMKVRQSSIDPLYNKDVDQAEKNNMIVIGYAFGYNASGADQADAFYVNFPPKPGRIMMLDLESNGNNTMTNQQAIDFVNRIKARTGQYPLLYASESRARPGALANCPRYTAAWGPVNPPSGAQLWQFTDGVVGKTPHSFPGVGSCDINQAVITYAQLRQMAGLDK
ncbi:MAG: GH25 family lysozyme [Elusimicrobia bacterium]|nr:GH25 family lysozyme [Elusimicrobiota bacterium]